MSTVLDVLAQKGFEVHTIASSATVLEAARTMSDRRVGGLVVMDEGNVVGMFTERDVLRRVVTAGRDPQLTYVCETMTREVVTIEPTTDLSQASSIMKCHRLRHLPVVCDEGDLLGILSMRDVHAFDAAPRYVQPGAFQSPEAMAGAGA